MKWIIDRFEGDYGVVECGDLHFNVPKNALPDNIAEGDILTLSLDVLKTADTKEQLQGRLKKLFGE